MNPTGKMLQRISFTFLVVCLIFGFVSSEDVEYDEYTDNSIDLERTHLSTPEKTIKTLMVPLQVIDSTAEGIQDTVIGILKHLPGPLKDTVEGSGRVAQGFGDILNRIKDKFRAIYPGTKWCGDGDIAENEDDLGIFEKTDACCRAHDSCQDGIPAQGRRASLLNTGIFTRSNCTCDGDFYHCLKDVHGLVAMKIGYTFFNVLKPQCFKEDYPVIGCKKYSRSGLLDRKCTDYEFDYNGRPRLQWFDNPDF